jgi:gluconate 2-dehydrogenase alpha chain
LRTLCNVVKVNLDSEKKRALSVTYVDSRGREFEQPAELVLPTPYVLNNARLMLLSGIGQPHDPVANRAATSSVRAPSRKTAATTRPGRLSALTLHALDAIKTKYLKKPGALV